MNPESLLTEPPAIVPKADPIRVEALRCAVMFHSGQPQRTFSNDALSTARTFEKYLRGE